MLTVALFAVYLPDQTPARFVSGRFNLSGVVTFYCRKCASAMQCSQLTHMRHDLTPIPPAKSCRPPLCVCKSYPSRHLPSTTPSSSRLSVAKAAQASEVASISRVESASALVPQRKADPAGSAPGSKDEQELRRRSQQAILSAYPFTLHQLVVFKVSITYRTCSKLVACASAQSPRGHWARKMVIGISALETVGRFIEASRRRMSHCLGSLPSNQCRMFRDR